MLFFSLRPCADGVSGLMHPTHTQPGPVLQEISDEEGNGKGYGKGDGKGKEQSKDSES